MTPRVRPGFRRLATVAAIILLPVAAHSLWDYIELRRVIREIKAIQARSQPVTDSEAGRGYKKHSPDEDLAARLYTAAAAIGYPVAADVRDLIPSLVAQATGTSNFAGDRKTIEARLRAAMIAGEDALRFADRANALPFTGFGAGHTYSYQTSELLRLLELEWLRAAHLSLTESGDIAVAALRHLIVSRRVLPEELQQWASSTGFDTAVALALSYADPSADALRALETFLAERANVDVVRELAIGDRASFIERVFRHLYSGDPSAPQTAGTQLRGRGLGWEGYFWRPWLSRRFTKAIRDWNAVVDASSLPWPDRARTMTAAYQHLAGERQRKRSTEDHTPPNWWSPQLNLTVLGVLPRSFKQLVLERVAAVVSGVARFKAEQGRVPGTLDEMGPIPRHLLDPWTAAPMRFRVEAGSYTVYSVGPDGNDDGGDIRGNDIGIRVLLNPK